jgi:hypothetical protein
VVIENSTIAENAADLGGLVVVGGTALLRNVTIAHNRSGQIGAGMFLQDTTTQLENSLVAENVRGTDVADCVTLRASGAALTRT